MTATAPKDRPALDEAAAWFARIKTPVVSADTMEQFRVWRQQPGNREAYRQIERTWTSTGKLGSSDLANTAVQAALARGAARQARRRNRPIWILSAATLAIGTTVVGLALITAFTQTDYRTGVGEQRLVRLSDGSAVRLDTATHVIVRLSRGRRDVRLVQGQAFFDVAHDARRPFVVDAGQAKVQALGTQFDVRRDGEFARVTLVAGRVRVDRGRDGATRSVTLEPGQQVVAARTLEPVRKVDLKVATSWTSGMIIFEDVPLTQAIAEINRYSPKPVRLAPGYVSSAPVTGVFESGDIEAFVGGVSALRGLKASRQADGAILLSPAAASPEG